MARSIEMGIGRLYIEAERGDTVLVNHHTRSHFKAFVS